MNVRAFFFIAVAFVLGMIVATTVSADDFRVETEIYVGDGKQPVVQTLTIFSGDVVYDFMLGTSDKITVFDVRRGRIVLLDAKRQMKTTLTTERLLEFTAAIKARAALDEKYGLLDPVLATSFDEEAGELTLSSEPLTYRVRGVKPKDPTAAQRYQTFADWYARLNAACGNLPPFGRIALNQALAQRDLMPSEVERTTVTDKRSTVRSEHTTNWILSNTDRKRIDKVGRLMAGCQETTLAEFWGSNASVADAR